MLRFPHTWSVVDNQCWDRRNTSVCVLTSGQSFLAVQWEHNCVRDMGHKYPGWWLPACVKASQTRGKLNVWSDLSQEGGDDHCVWRDRSQPILHISIGQEPINTTINLHRISSDEFLTNCGGLCIFHGRVYVADVELVWSRRVIYNQSAVQNQ